MGRILGLVANFTFNIILAREIAPDHMGQYFLLFNLVTFFAIFSRFGCENYALKVYADAINSRTSTDKILKIIFSIFLIASVCTISLVYLASATIFDEVFSLSIVSSTLIFVLLWFTLIALQAVLAELLRAGNQFLKAALTKGTLGYILNFVILFIAYYIDFDIGLIFVIKVIVFNLMLVSSISIYWVLKQNSSLNRVSNIKVSSFNIYVALTAISPLFINQIAMFVTSQSDLWLLGAFYSAEDTAYYGAAARLVLLTGLALTIANGVLPPFISKFRVNNDKAALERVVRSVATAAAIPAIAIIGVFILYSEEVLQLIYGNSYGEAGDILKVLSVAQLVNVLVGSCGYVLIMHGYNRQFMVYSLLGSVVSLVLSIMFIMLSYDAIFIALSFSIGIISQQILMLYGALKYTGIKTYIYCNLK